MWANLSKSCSACQEAVVLQKTDLSACREPLSQLPETPSL
jgi:hypothetical protein